MGGEQDFQPFQSSSQRVGTITQWMDEKAFGWVESGGKRWFAHIKDFDRGQRRPMAGEEVRFTPGFDLKGRSCAKRLTIVKGDGAAGIVRSRGVGGWALLPLMLALPLVALLWLPDPWWVGAGWMLIVSLITAIMYAYDKGQAVSGGWRVSESSLHLAELLGGWPGAFWAQRRLRHKCLKSDYQAVFWLIVLIYQFAAVDLITDHRLIRVVLGFLNR